MPESNDIMYLNTNYLVATYITSGGNLILKFATNNDDNEIIIRYNDNEKAQKINDYIWGVNN